MDRLFGPLSANEQVLFASRENRNKHITVIGTAEEIVDYLRRHPRVQEAMGILKMYPKGFMACVTNGKGEKSEKKFRMRADGTQQVAYVKAGWETMACVKPLDLFNKDCTLGTPISDFLEYRKVRQAEDAAAAEVTA